MTASTPMERLLRSHGTLALVTVKRVEGSAPREVGAAMAVAADGTIAGTIGGGALEWAAISRARTLLAGDEAATTLDVALGPSLGQCCGGRVTLGFRRLDSHDAASLAEHEAGRQGGDLDVALFGAGHVGRALVLALAPLSARVTWLDPRPDAFPQPIVGRVVARVLNDAAVEIGRLEGREALLVMTHDHALDLSIVDAALRRTDFPFIGLIGSATKRARFEARLRAAGHAEAAIARLTCPIGLPGIPGKAPAVIAASVVAQLLSLGLSDRAPSKSNVCPPGLVA